MKDERNSNYSSQGNAARTLTRRRVLANAAVTAVVGGIGVSTYLLPLRAHGQSLKTVRYWTTQGAPAQRAVYADIARLVAQAYPNIELVIEYVSDNDVRTKLAAAMAGGTPPEIVANVGITTPASMAAAGLLEPMDEAVRLVGSDNFERNALSLYEVRAGHHDALPISNTSAGVFWYREDIFQEAGLAVPRYWDEFLGIAKKLTAHGIYGACLPYGRIGMSSDYFSMLLYNAGGYILAPDDSLIFNSEPTVAALEFLKEIREYCPPGANSYSYSETLAGFVNGASATGLYTGRVLANVAVQNPKIDQFVRCSRFPYRREGGRYWHAAGFPSQFIPKGAANVAEANMVAAFQYRPEIYTKFLLGAPGQNIPVLKGISTSEAFLGNPILARHKREVATLVEICSEAETFSKPSPQHKLNPKLGLVWTSWVLGEIVQKVVVEGMQPKAAAAWGQDKIAAILKNGWTGDKSISEQNRDFLLIPDHRH
jgi:multiple sugar transport system substrate-binding protein